MIEPSSVMEQEVDIFFSFLYSYALHSYYREIAGQVA